MKVVQSSTITISVFIWIGFIAAISFMESWLKFSAEGVTIPIGLGIGRLVFGMLNKVEWILAIIILGAIVYQKQFLSLKNNYLYYFSIFLLILQTVWLLPALDTRAQMYIDGLIDAENSQRSYNHFIYAGMEVVKVVCLSLYGWQLFKTVKK
jgi:hypothetical protein